MAGERQDRLDRRAVARGVMDGLDRRQAAPGERVVLEGVALHAVAAEIPVIERAGLRGAADLDQHLRTAGAARDDARAAIADRGVGGGLDPLQGGIEPDDMVERVGDADPQHVVAVAVFDHAVDVVAGVVIHLLAERQIGQRDLVQRVAAAAVAGCKRGAVGAEGGGDDEALLLARIAARNGAEGFGVGAAIQQRAAAGVVNVADAHAQRARAVGIPVPYVGLAGGDATDLAGRDVGVPHGRIDIRHRVDPGRACEQDARAAVLGRPEQVVGADARIAPVDPVERLQIGAEADHAGDVDILPAEVRLAADAGDEPLITDPAPPVDVHILADLQRGGLAVEQRHDDEALDAIDRHLRGDARAVGRQAGGFEPGQLGKNRGGDGGVCGGGCGGRRGGRRLRDGGGGEQSGGERQRAGTKHGHPPGGLPQGQ
ncbi:hypothetical protein WR25_25107 [Diploscapter pachys]|uniref:Uncharacterized protein n=1 Tax=Diploscapter pachys TaxID=2018661 RepID=A0A2A2M2T4_9BILA|nr:hypothetical protein WR25_25107 [Diploscapter pachys]